MEPKRHTINLDSRSTLRITAVDEVVSFDESLVSLAVGDSLLDIVGGDLSIKNLSLENGEVLVEGRVDSISYFDGAPRKKRFGFFGK